MKDNYTNSNSLEFRVTYDRAQKNDQQKCKTVVKIEPQYMQRLGIRQGDVVKISGNTKSTAAACLAITPQELKEIEEMSPDLEVEYVNNPKKKARLAPKAIIYGPVSCNIDPSYDWQRTVTISKFPESQGNAENICDAKTVILATMDLADKLMHGYKDNLDYSEIVDFIISKNDRINIPFQQKWLERKQKEIQESIQQENTGRPNRRPRRPESFFPRTFQSAVVSVKPEGKQFWRITKDTEFEFENTDIAKIFDPHRFRPKNLINVIPISKQLLVEDTEFTIPSLEVYSDRMKLVWYSHQRIKIPESEFGDPLKMNKIQDMIHTHDSPRLLITITDDSGNQYHSTNEGGGGGGGSSGPDPSTREIVSDYSWNQFFSPSLDKNAKEITIIIQEIHWLRRKRNASGMAPSPPTTAPPDITLMKPKHLPKIVIAEGPWEYKIPVNPPPE